MRAVASIGRHAYCERVLEGVLPIKHLQNYNTSRSVSHALCCSSLQLRKQAQHAGLHLRSQRLIDRCSVGSPWQQSVTSAASLQQHIGRSSGLALSANLAQEAATASDTKTPVEALLQQAIPATHWFWDCTVIEGDTVVDATCGNGHDTVYLCGLVGSAGRVYAFDVQAEAIERTRARVESSGCNGAQPVFINACHSTMQQHVGSGVAQVCFNLGYLPGGDKSIISQVETTVKAVEAALEVIKPGGSVNVTAYIGHQGGKEEYEAVKELMASLPLKYWVCCERRQVNVPTAPIMLLIHRKLHQSSREH